MPASAITKEVADGICALVADGMFVAHAAAEYDIPKQTVASWEKRGQAVDAGEAGAESEWTEHDKLCSDFARKLAVARAKCERHHMGQLVEKSVGSMDHRPDWKAHQWILSKLNPKEFGDSKRTELTGEDGGPIVVKGPTIMVPPDCDD